MALLALGADRVSEPTELWAYVVFASQDTMLAEVVRVAGTHWVIKQLFEAAKGDMGLGRIWTG